VDSNVLPKTKYNISKRPRSAKIGCHQPLMADVKALGSLEHAENCIARALAVEALLCGILAADSQATQAQFTVSLPRTTSDRDQ
jgi:hypothetical protein